MSVVHLILAVIIFLGLHKPHCVAGQKQTKLNAAWLRSRLSEHGVALCRPDDVAVIIFIADEYLNKLSIVTTGAFISPTRVITSYNPFRDIIQDDAWSANNTRVAFVSGLKYEIEKKKKTDYYQWRYEHHRGYYLRNRPEERGRRQGYHHYHDYHHYRDYHHYNQDSDRPEESGRQHTYDYDWEVMHTLPEESVIESHERVICGRQVIPLIGNNNSKVFYIDANKRYSPTHDLMVFRIGVAKVIADPSTSACYSPPGKNLTDLHYLLGLYMATPFHDILQMKNLKIVGFDLRVAKTKTKLHSVEITTDAIVDCDNWIPREWGYFICLLNLPGLKVLTSGSILFDYNKLFGIGSFKMSKHGRDILVFTDVRPYRVQLSRACSISEFGSYPSDAWW